MTRLVVPLTKVGMGDLDEVGGKNASLGEMISSLAGSGVKVPGGFAITAAAFRAHLDRSGVAVELDALLGSLDVADVVALAAAGEKARDLVGAAALDQDLQTAIAAAYAEMGEDVAVAVRSSATAEDLPDASFAGQQDTYLNVVGVDAVLDNVAAVFASAFTDRAIAYRAHHGFAHGAVAMSVGVQHMVRSDLASSGVAFSIDTESGFEDVVFITSSYGLGELLVQGAVEPDEFYVHKPALTSGHDCILQKRLGSKHAEMILAGDGGDASTVDVARSRRDAFTLSDEEIIQLAHHVVAIEEHYGRPMDVEWAKDGADGDLYIVQARPETVQSRIPAAAIERYRLVGTGDIITTGRSVGQRIGSGIARVIHDPADMERLGEGEVLVASMTDPDWEPVMKRAAAIITDRGGRTCHAAIIARELGIPAIVGTSNATSTIADGQPVTASCAEGDDGQVYAGEIDFVIDRMPIAELPDPPTKIMMNVASPDQAFGFSRIPNHGVGLARIEFIVNNSIGVHPQALLDYERLPAELRDAIDRRMAGYDDPEDFFVSKLREGVARIAAAFAPKPVIVRMSDFKSNEYAHLLGGDRYEAAEENPMIGFRGAARYRDPQWQQAFALECRALRQVRDDMGLRNVEIMVPFVRTVAEAREVVDRLAVNGIERGRNGLRLIMMCEVPSNAILADQFLDLFDGFSIGSNDLTQLTLALDRDSEVVAALFNERDPAVKQLVSMAIAACRRRDKYVGICGQGPSDHPDFAAWLVAEGIDSISLNPDTVLETWLYLADAVPERTLPRGS